MSKLLTALLAAVCCLCMTACASSNQDTYEYAESALGIGEYDVAIALFEQLGDEILRRHTTPDEVRIVDTICRQVSGREQHLEGFAARFDVVVFVCGRKSSNGKVLFEVCRRTNPRTYNIEEAGELDPAWLEGVSTVGICGATSTPKWQLEGVAKHLQGL